MLQFDQINALKRKCVEGIERTWKNVIHSLLKWKRMQEHAKDSIDRSCSMIQLRCTTFIQILNLNVDCDWRDGATRPADKKP